MVYSGDYYHSISEHSASERPLEEYYSPRKAFADRWVTLGLAIYWFSYWMMAGFDKFCGRKEFGLFNWYGTENVQKMISVFERIGLRYELISPVVVFSGLWQLALTIPFVMAIDSLFSRRIGSPDRTPIFMSLGIFFSVLNMILSTIFAILSGEQAEIMMSGLFTALLVITYIAMQIERMFSDLTRDLR